MSRKAYSEEEREGIRVGLMDRAMTLFSEKGIRDTNIDEIRPGMNDDETVYVNPEATEMLEHSRKSK